MKDGRGMKTFRATAVLIFFFVFLATNFEGQKRKTLEPSLSTDPVFGIGYDHKVVHYDLFPEKFRTLCADTKRGKDLWGIFAHVTSGSAEYFIVNQIMPIEDDYGWGLSVLIVGGKCIESGTDWSLGGIPPAHGYKETGIVERLPRPEDPDDETLRAENHDHAILRSAHEEAILRGLARDAIQRG